MMRNAREALAGIALLVCSSVAKADAPKTVIPKMVFCEAVPTGNATTGWGWPVGPDFHRDMKFYIRLEPQNRTNDPKVLQEQIGATTSLEYCSYFNGSPLGCTPIYPSASFPALAPTVEGLQNIQRTSGYTSSVGDVFAFWNGTVGHYLRVNGGSPNLIDDLTSNGACVEPKQLASVGDFVVWGMQPGMNPFGTDAAGFDVCTQSSAIREPAFGRWQPNLCISDEQANFIAFTMSGIDDAMTHRVQGSPLMQTRIVAGKNGASGLQSHVIVLPNWAGGGTGGPSDFRMNPGGLQCIDPTKDMRQRPAPGTCGFDNHLVVGETLQLASHEWFHVLQSKWTTKFGDKGSVLVPNRGVLEGTAKAVEANLCSFFPGAETQICNSAFDIGARETGIGIYGSLMLLRAPETDVLEPPYESSIFWNYLFEQFSYPVGTSPHPSGDASTLQRSCLAGPSCPAGNDPEAEFPQKGRQSDEGIDFFGLFFDTAAHGPDGDTFHQALDRALTTHLGRSLNDTAFDFQTALYLKDYENPAAKYRLEWVQWEDDGDFPNADHEPLRSQFPPSGTLYQNQRFDGLQRRFRALDSRGVCRATDPTVHFTQCDVCCGPTLTTNCSNEPPCDPGTGRVSLHAGGVISDVTSVGARGGTAMSINPGSDLIGSSVGVHVSAELGDVRIRAYRIQRGPSKKSKLPYSLVPEPLCQGGECEFSLRSTDTAETTGSVTLFAPVDKDTDEILVIAGAGGSSNRFSWAFSAGGNAALDIVEPTESLPGFLGHPNGPEGVLPVLAKLSLRNSLGDPIDVSDGDLTVEVPGCAKASCVLPADAVEVVSGLMGGHALVLLRVPDDFFPPAPNEVRLSLKVTAKGVTATRNNALLTVEKARTQTTMLVMDVSGSMADDFKINGARTVAKAIARSMVPVGDTGACAAAGTCPNSFGMVTFNTDASTPLPPTPIHGGTIDTIDAIIELAALPTDSWA